MCMYVKHVHGVTTTSNLHVVTGDIVRVWIVLALGDLERCIRHLIVIVQEKKMVLQKNS
jgi:hypothetical protein